MTYTEEFCNEIREILSRVVEHQEFASSPLLKKILLYLVEEELAGRGTQIKAFSIAIDVMGRNTEFDAQTDPAVRVNLGRLRKALKSHYEAAKVQDRIKIEIPKGSYRPTFVILEEKQAVTFSSKFRNPLLGASFRKSSILGFFGLIALIVGTALVGYNIFYHQENDNSALSGQTEERPTLLVNRFDSSQENGELSILDGYRRQLVSDLSHFRTVSVRVYPEENDILTNNINELPLPDFTLDGKLLTEFGTSKLNLVLTNVELGTIAWSSSVVLPSNDREYQSFLFQSVGDIVRQIAGISGKIQIDALDRLKNRRDRLSAEKESTYECVLLFHAYDVSKDQELERQSRSCLKRLTENGTRDSSVWSAWAFLQFLDWTKRTELDDDTLLRNAERDARRAIQLDPFDAAGHEYLGSIQMAEGRFDDAMNAYETAIQLNPSKPDLQVLLGWHTALAGDWQNGIPMIEKGVDMSLAPAGWMYIPLAINSFREKDFEKSLQYSRTIIDTGDPRGYVLALAASIKTNNKGATQLYLQRFLEISTTQPTDPMREIRSVFNSPEILKEYSDTIFEANVF